ncbi:MAG: sugar-binding transcriptional regulator [Paracoccaceae bacterium]
MDRQPERGGGAGDADQAPPARAPYDATEQLITRAAWLYFVEGQTQQEIARHLGINRIRVNRMLATARENGIVRVTIDGPVADCVKQERALQARFGLSVAVVVPTAMDQDNIRRMVAYGAGRLLSGLVHDGMVLGVGWGRTLRLSLDYIPRRPLPTLEVVSMTGGLTRGSALNSYETALRMSDHFGAMCCYMAGPAFAESEETRDLFLRHPMLADALAHAARADVAYISVGGLHDAATMLSVGLIDRDDVASLRRARAVGDILGYWIDAEGRVVDHDLNRRALALHPERLSDIGNVILASGGLQRAPAILAALRRGWIDTLITDEATARQVLGAPE